MRVDPQPMLGLLLGALAIGSAAADDAGEAVPDLAFIEYLGTLIPGDDGWITPQDLRGEEELKADLIAARAKERAADLEKQP